MSDTITIPYKFTPRIYQRNLLAALDGGFNRAITAWHRRAGKDKTLFNLIIKKSLERIGTYYYFFPEFAQGRRVIWDGIDNDGFKFLDHIPKGLIKQAHKVDMKIELTNGSIIQIIGTDKFDKVRGSNPIGCVFSEFAYQNPKAWDVVRPILRLNGGWAAFNSTMFGKNHFYNLLEMAKHNPDWYVDIVTVEDSLDENGERYVPEKWIDQDRAEGYSEEMILQEYYCDPTANSEGYYYLKQIATAEADNKITNVPYTPGIEVDTWWDIGVSDSTAIWFTQKVGRAIHVIDFHQDNSIGIAEYAKKLKELPYGYGSHFFPHDMAQVEFGTGKSRIEVAGELLGVTSVEVLPKLSIAEGINAARITIPLCYFDKEKCAEGLEALRNYHRQWDSNLQEFKNRPVHDWSSHPADGFRYLAVGITLPKVKASRQSTFKTRLAKKSTTRNWSAL